MAVDSRQASSAFFEDHGLEGANYVVFPYNFMQVCGICDGNFNITLMLREFFINEQIPRFASICLNIGTEVQVCVLQGQSIFGVEFYFH